MFRVRQAAGTQGGAPGLAPFNQKVAELARSMTNLQANGLEFSASDALQLSIPLLKARTPLLVLKKPPCKKHFFCSEDFAKTVVKASLTSSATPTPLALPKFFLNPNEDTAGIVPRTFHHHSDFITVTPVEELFSTGGAAAPSQVTQFGEKPRYPWPRCGLTGLFYRREEIVDNLTQAAIALQFQSPFWIPENHPELGKFLQLKPDSQPIVISITSRVAPVEVVKILPPQLIAAPFKGVKYQNLKPKDKTSPFHNAKVAPGANIFTGEVSQNPYLCGTTPSPAFQQHEVLRGADLAVNNRGIWISLDQFVRHGLALRDELVASPISDGNGDVDATASLLSHINQLLEIFVPVETKQLALFNADQLVVPGRLSLKTRSNPSQVGDIIEVFH